MSIFLDSPAALPQDYPSESGFTMAESIKLGDKVKWDTPQGETEGTVEKTLTSPTKIKGHEIKASKDNPEYLVRSEKSGKEAAHKPDEIKKAGK